MPCGFGKKKILSCSCCGQQVLWPTDQSQYRRVHFHLNNGTPTFLTFCPECSTHLWTTEKIEAMNIQGQDGWHALVCFAKLEADPGAPHECKYEGNMHQPLRILDHAPEYPIQTWDDLQAEGLV